MASVAHPGATGSAEETIGPTTVSMRFSWDVTDVTDGVATVVVHRESMKVQQSGETIPVGSGPASDITLKIDERGVILAVESLADNLPPGFMESALPFDPSRLGIQTNIVMPESGSANPGDEWQAETIYPIPGGTDRQVKAVTKAELVSVETKGGGGGDLATIDFTADVPIDIALDLASIVAELGLGALIPPDRAEDLAFVMTKKGAEAVAGITEAPAIVPAGQRGLFSIDLETDPALTRVD